MRGSTVRGTPVHHVTQGSRGEGQRGGEPRGMQGQTTHENYQSESRGYRDEHFPHRGTPYTSEDGNPPNARRTVGDHPTHGIVHSESGLDMNDPKSSIGQGVVLDDGAHRYEGGFQTTAHTPTEDSPVPGHAPHFDPGFIAKEDRAHLGSGNERGVDDLVRAGGVMSRGMEGTSRHGESETVGDEDSLASDERPQAQHTPHRR